MEILGLIFGGLVLYVLFYMFSLLFCGFEMPHKILIPVFVVAVVIAHFGYNSPESITERVLEKELGKSYNEFGAEIARDGWGNPVEYKKSSGDSFAERVCMSAGKDGKWNTKDDIVKKDIDADMGFVLGKKVGQNVESFVKGLKKGKCHERF